MNTAPPIISIFLLLFASAAFAGSGDDLLQRVKAKYASCESFRCEGENKTTSDRQGKERPFRSEKKFRILFKRPDLLRVDWSEPSMASFTPTVCSLYTENGKYYGVSSFQRTPEEFSSLQMGMGAYAGISGGNTYFLPSLLFGKFGYLRDYSCELLPDVQYDGVDCSVIEAKDARTGKWTFTVNKATLALLRVQQVHTITAEQSKAMMEEARKRMKDRSVPFPEAAANDYTIETDTTYRNVEFDKSMTAADFVFTEKK